jgi:hypothetical protein
MNPPHAHIFDISKICLLFITDCVEVFQVVFFLQLPAKTLKAALTLKPHRRTAR